MVGGLGVDSLVRTPLLDKETLSKQIGFDFGKRNLLVTYHPETLSDQPTEAQFLELLRALRRFPEINVIFTYPNADMGGQAIAHLIEEHVAATKNWIGYQSLGHKKYLSCLQFVDGVVGNSSSGLLEVPTFKKGTINIGQRQAGRLKADSVIDCDANEDFIVAAIERLYSSDFLKLLEKNRNPYGDGGASAKIVSYLSMMDWNELLLKSFVDLSLINKGCGELV
jgi:GDP/UDP-N,N'-diacetylbacillosamine 2-epimerase (hydrolysing)